jgi:OOP family OmpA-OmpF porin
LTENSPTSLSGSALRRALGIGAFAGAAAFSALFAWGTAIVVENLSENAVTSRLLSDGITWAQVDADGLQVILSGTAPNEGERYRVVSMTGAIVDSSRVRDALEVTAARAFEAPRFSLEMLRNEDGIQVIGLVPDAKTEEDLVALANSLSPDKPVSDMIETAAYPPPESWAPALAFGTLALQTLPRSKVSVDASRVVVTAIAASGAEKREFEAQLTAQKPEGVELMMDISAPRPVLTPFTLRFVKDADGARFDSCSADTDAARNAILAAAAEAGTTGRQNCTIGLGVPTPSWGPASVSGIMAVADLGLATITFKDADVTLVAAPEVTQADFDRVVGELESALPDVFSLTATLEKRPDALPEGPANFTATLSGETNRVELRGRLADEMTRLAVEGFAKAQFGTKNVLLATRTDAGLPTGWSVRVLAGLEALGQLSEGSLVVQADTVQIRGRTGSADAKVRISQILSSKLGQGRTFSVDVTYDEALDPVAALPKPDECAAAVATILERQKITFAPGSTEIATAANGVMTALADALNGCPGITMEVGGHTDAQGSEGGNMATSQARAEAVVLALQGRQVDVSGLRAKGYGETRPIADNETEAGREANRRIEFTLIKAKVDATAPAAAPMAEGEAPASAATAADGTPDFSADTSPSVAPAEKTKSPLARPEQNE